MAPTATHDCELLCELKLLDLIPIVKYRSIRTGLTICVANVEGPLVNGYFCLATEAHDDDGLPHTLEHLVFMGSEKYPYKGLLDLFANRCLAQGTNAWTDVDHTCYTITTAGSEGFLNMLPIYLDHVLYPTLTKSAYLTEVHHINGDGEDAGIVYCEMQARENTGSSRTQLELTRSMYPGHCGYKSETGGLTKNLRTSCSHEKVCNYHSAYYRPDNLCLVITGQVKADEVLKVVNEYEERILAKGKLPEFTRPWQTPVPQLPDSLERVVQFPTEDESNGMFVIAWRGPHVQEYYDLAALDILMQYLTDTSAAPLQKELVEIEDPFCSDIDYSEMENLETSFYLKASGVPKEKLSLVKERIEKVLDEIASGKAVIDMERMNTVIHREILDGLDKLEDSPHDTMAQGIIGDFLYSTAPEQLKEYMNDLPRLEKLKKESSEFWVALLKEYLINRPKIVIIGDPSEKMMKDMAEEEKQRIAEQRKELGEDGLSEKEEALENATDDNEEEPPANLVGSMKVPSTDSIPFHSIRTITNRQAKDNTIAKVPKFQVSEIPFAFQLDDIKSLFLQMTVVLNTSLIPHDLRFYLPLYADIIFESPILRDGVLIPHNDVVKQLAADTLSNSSSLGVYGGTFSPGKFSEIFMLQLKMEVSKFEKGIQWLRELLYSIQFTEERLKIVGTKILNDIPNAKRSGKRVAQALIHDIYYVKGSNFYSSNMMRQQKFLTQMMDLLATDPKKVVDDMEKLRSILTNPASLQLFMAVDSEKLQPDANAIICEKFLPKEVKMHASESAIPIKSDHQLASSNFASKIIGIGAVESSFFYQSSPCITSYNDPDYAPLLILIEYLCALEGPLWRQIRGLGLAYHYSMSVDPSSGKLTFLLMKSTHIFAAFQKGKQIVKDFISGETPFEEEQLEAAISGVIFETIEKEQTVCDAAFQSMVSTFKGVSQQFSKELLQRVSTVTLNDLKTIANKYFVALFDSNTSCSALCCHPSKVEEIVKDFKGIGVDLQIVNSMDDEFTL
eukprot:Seg42.13_Seg42.8 transcript_id=Seg42.13_Seg42.8/GoldUCD/mRNA.D3Y31 product="putative protein C05D11.1" protein_id=Seg42.13_Seg42.8/GoldUCD/D3Y31